MEIFLAKTSGFCFGVKRAVSIVSNLLDQGCKVCTLGPLIHNKVVIEKFKKLGVVIAENVKEIPKGYTMVIRSHGVPEKFIEYLEKNSLKYIDATCPFVKKIHKIVKKESKLGKLILIAGDKNHPEVKGIIGYCVGEYIVFKDKEELKKLYKFHINSNFSGVILVSQTTFNKNEWIKCVNLTKNLFTNPIIYDTICNTTQLRQKEAEILSKKSNYMVVIGDKNSSNTKKLYNICKKNCNTMLVESSKDLELKCLKNCDCVGIIAGASTPRETIEEVKGAMEKHFGLENEKEENFEQLLEESLKGSSKGRIVKGKVVSIGANEVYVDVVGMKHSGVIPRAELTNVPNISLAEVVNVGDELDLLITYINDQEGTVTLSKLKADLDLHWKEFEEARESGTVLVGRVCRVVKSGLLVSYRSLDVFIPSSQVGGSKMIPFESYLDKDVEFKIIDLDKRKKRIVGSIKEVKEETQRTKLHEFWNSVEIGKAYRGIVKSITNYAVFVDLGCIDGIVHISELTWDRSKKPSDVVTLGQEIEVKVKSFDRENNKLSLTYKKPEDSPWVVLKEKYPVGTVCEAEVVGLTPFGAFAKLLPGIDGLLHVSQISEKHIASPADVLHVGQRVKVKIKSIDEEAGKVGLTMRGLD